jgi:hypothetical protein
MDDDLDFIEEAEEQRGRMGRSIRRDVSVSNSLGACAAAWDDQRRTSFR